MRISHDPELATGRVLSALGLRSLLLQLPPGDHHLLGAQGPVVQRQNGDHDNHPRDDRDARIIDGEIRATWLATDTGEKLASLGGKPGEQGGGFRVLGGHRGQGQGRREELVVFIGPRPGVGENRVERRG